MERIWSLDGPGSIPSSYDRPDGLDRSLFEATVEQAIAAAAEAADRLQVPIDLLDHSGDVDPTCERGWCRAPLIYQARPR